MKKSFLFLALICSTSFASANQAVLKAINGAVTIESGSVSSAAREGQSIGAKDRVKVGPGAVTQLVFPNGDAVLVKGVSTFQLSEDKKGPLVSFEEGEFLIGLPAVSQIDPIYVNTFAVKGSLQGVDTIIKRAK